MQWLRSLFRNSQELALIMGVVLILIEIGRAHV